MIIPALEAKCGCIFEVFIASLDAVTLEERFTLRLMVQVERDEEVDYVFGVLRERLKMAFTALLGREYVLEEVVLSPVYAEMLARFLSRPHASVEEQAL